MHFQRQTYPRMQAWVQARHTGALVGALALILALLLSASPHTDAALHQGNTGNNVLI